MTTVKQIGKESWAEDVRGQLTIITSIKELDDLIAALTHQSMGYWEVNSPQEPLTQQDIDAEMARDDWRKKKED